MAEKDQQFVEMIVKEIVDYPDDVKVERTVDERGVFIQLSINPEDMGKVIGKEGRTAKALRTLLRIVGAKENARVNLKIVEPEGSTFNQHREEQSEQEPESKPEVAEEQTEPPVAEEKPKPKKKEEIKEESDTQPIEENATEIL